MIVIGAETKNGVFKKTDRRSVTITCIFTAHEKSSPHTMIMAIVLIGLMAQSPKPSKSRIPPKHLKKYSVLLSTTMLYLPLSVRISMYITTSTEKYSSLTLLKLIKRLNINERR